MKKVTILFMFLATVFLFSQTQTVQADIGPKPSVKITIIGVEEEYYFDVLVRSSDPGTYVDNQTCQYYEDSYPSVLSGYKDDEGFVSYCLIRDTGHIRSEETDVYTMGYHAPSSMKIVLVMKDNDAIIVSDYFEVQYFRSEITWDLTGENLDASKEGIGELGGDIDEPIDYSETYKNAAIRLVLTLIIEVAILFIFMYRKLLTYAIVIAANIITQIALSWVLFRLYVTGGIFGFVFWFAFCELIVLIVEVAIYMYFVNEHSTKRVVLYAIAANLVSVILGLMIGSIY